MDAKLLRKIEAEGLVSHMNKTKWNSLVTAILEGDIYKPHCLIKYLDDQEPLGPSQIDWWAYSGGSNMNQIELVALDPIERIRRGRLVDPELVDHKTELVEALTRMKIPFVDEDGYIKIFGYTRPASATKKQAGEQAGDGDAEEAV